MSVFITLFILKYLIPSYHNHIIKTKRHAASVIIPATPGASTDVPRLPALFVIYVGADCVTVFVEAETENETDAEDEAGVEVVPGMMKEMMMAPSPLSAVFVVVVVPSPDPPELVFVALISVDFIFVEPVCVVLASVSSGPNTEMMMAPRPVPVITNVVPPTTTCVPPGGIEYTVPEIVIAGPPATRV